MSVSGYALGRITDRPHGNTAVLTAVLVFAILLGLFAYVYNPMFLSVGNVISLAQETASIGVGALGMTYLIAAGFFDLSVSGIVPLAAASMAFVHGLDPGWAGEIASVVAALAVGVVAGGINGALVTVVRIPAFITTLGTLYVFTSVVEIVTNGNSVTIDGQIPTALANETVFTIVPLGLIALGLIALGLNYGLWRSRFGRYVRMIGVSQKAAQVWGVPVKSTVFLAFCLSGLTAACGGILLGGMFSSATATMAPDFNLNTIAAVVIGGTRLEGGRASILGTVVGAVLLAEITNVLTILGINPYFQYVAVGALLVLVVGLGNDRIVGGLSALVRRTASSGSPEGDRKGTTIPEVGRSAARPDGPVEAPVRPSSAQGDSPTVELVDISHSYGQNRVLKHVNFTVSAGQCLGLIGQNGAGKSTIINILSGKIQPVEGSVKIAGATTVLPNPKAARLKGISVVAQELELAPTLSVADNIVLGVEPTIGRLFLSNVRKRRIAQRAIERLGVQIDPGAIVEELPLGEQQLTEICRSLAMNCRLIIFDEPTSSLNTQESRRLLQIIGDLKRSGCAIIFVSHKLGEVLSVCDTLCVVRDGEVVGMGTPDSLGGHDGVTELLLSKALEGNGGGGPTGAVRELAAGKETAPSLPGGTGGVAVSVRNLIASDVRIDRLDCRYGEIVGFAGVEGSGSNEAIEAIAGLQDFVTERFLVGDSDVPFESPRAAVRAGAVYLPPDRKNEGIFSDLSIAENIAVGADLPQRGTFSATRWEDDKSIFARTRERLAIKTSGPMQACRSLSGGNQQKALFGRAMASWSRIWLLSEPTRGIDIGSRRELYDLIRKRAADGSSIIIKSIDPAELAAVCDRCYVFSAGRIVHELVPGEISEEAIYSASYVAHVAEGAG